MELNCGSGLLSQRRDAGGNERSSALVVAPGLCPPCIPTDAVLVAVLGGCVPGDVHMQVEAFNSSPHSCSSLPLGKRQGAREQQFADWWVWAVPAEVLTCGAEKVKLFV